MPLQEESGGTPVAANRAAGKSAICTVVSKNYLAYARALAASVARIHPDIPFFVLLVDRVEGYFAPEQENFHLLTVEDLPNIPNLVPFLFKYTILELNTAVKPYLFEYLFDTYSLDSLIYFDPDILVFSPLDEIWRLLRTHTAVVTPHITAPIEDKRKQSETEIMQSGTFNLGFLGMGRTETLKPFLQWWQRRLYDFCIVDHARGYFTDQKWVDLAPGMFSGFTILTDPGCNVAYWNLHERGKDVAMSSEGEVTLRGRPLTFYHFSGFNTKDLNVIARHQDRFRLSDLPNLRPLYEHYQAQVLEHGHETVRSWPYAWTAWDNGVTIPNIARKVYREAEGSATRFPEPFAASSENSFYRWLIGEGRSGGGFSLVRAGLPALWQEVYLSAPNLQAAFLDPEGRDRTRYLTWIRENVKLLHPDIPDVMLPSLPESAEPRASADLTPAAIPAPTGLMRSARRVIGAPLKLALRNRRDVLDRIYFWSLGVRHVPPMNLPAASAVYNQGRNGYGTAIKSSDLPFGVNVAGYLAGEFGIAEASRSIVHALKATELPMTLNNIWVANKRFEDKTFQDFTDKNPYAFNLLMVGADVVPGVAAEKGKAWFEDRYTIGLWYWEQARFPEEFWGAFAPLDEIWVNSAFSAEAIAKASPKPVVKFNYPIRLDESQIRPERERFGIPASDDVFTFLFTFDFHSSIERKNPYGVIAAMRLAFKNRERDALLVIKSINGSYYPEELRKMQEAAKGLNVLFLEDYLERKDTLNLLASCDCYISLHRAEGLGLGIAEAMYLGKPVIATGYSGNMEFMNLNNSFPVRYHMTELTKDDGPYRRGSVWAEPDIEHAAERMRFLYEDRAAARRAGEAAARDLRLYNNPEIVGKQMRERLERICDL